MKKEMRIKLRKQRKKLRIGKKAIKRKGQK